MQGDEGNYLPVCWFEQKPSSWEDLQMRASGHFLLFNKMLALTTYLLSLDDGDTICEIVGGEARTTRVLVRHSDRRISTGPNFDLVADVDLTDMHEQEAFWKYRRQRKPKVCVMAPMCRSFGGRSRMNRLLYPETWKRNLDTVDGPLAQFAGQVAHQQLLDELDFVNEQPVGSSLSHRSLASSPEASSCHF